MAHGFGSGLSFFYRNVDDLLDSGKIGRVILAVRQDRHVGKVQSDHFFLLLQQHHHHQQQQGGGNFHSATLNTHHQVQLTSFLIRSIE